MKALVLLSGGLDSAVTLSEALLEGRDCTCLFIDYGQQNLEHERRAVEKLCKHYDVPVIEEKLSLKCWTESESALMGSGTNATNKGIYLHCRNLVFLSIAVAHAEAKGLGEIWLGFILSTEASHKDASPSFVKGFELAAMLGSNVDILLQTPLARIGKLGVMELAIQNSVPLGATRSCVANSKKPCGKCLPCREVIKAKIALRQLT